MYLNTLQVALKSRNENAKAYNLQITQGILDILFFIFEFKIATSWHISRIFIQKERDKYIYFKLRKMWEVGLLESFKVYAGSGAGMPVYYMVSKKGLKFLREQKKYSGGQMKKYPKAKKILSWSLFIHAAQVVELASMEALIQSNSLKMSFKREEMVGEYEVLSPDYTTTYTFNDKSFPIYTEVEQSNRSKGGVFGKIERHVRYIKQEQKNGTLLRIIFQTPAMEKSFWMELILGKPYFLSTLEIFTTNILFLNEPLQFCEPIYTTYRTVKLLREGRLILDTSHRTKLLAFL